MKKVLYTDQPREQSTSDKIGAFIALFIFFIVLPIGLAILCSGV